MSDSDPRPKAKKDQRYRCSLCHKAGQTIGYNAVHCHWDRIHKEHGHPSSRTFRDLHIEVAAPGVIVDGANDEPENDTEDDESGPTTTIVANVEDTATPVVRTKGPVKKKREKKRGINELLNDSATSTTSSSVPPQQSVDASLQSQDAPRHHRGSPRQSPHHHHHQHDAWTREMEHRRRLAASSTPHHHHISLPPPSLHSSSTTHPSSSSQSFPAPYAHHPIYHHHQPRHHPDHDHHHDDERLRGVVAAAALAQASSSSSYPESTPDSTDGRHVKREPSSGIKDLLNDGPRQHHPHHHMLTQHPPPYHQEVASPWEHAVERLGQRLVRAEETIMLLTHRCNVLSDANQHLGQLLTGVDANVSNLNGIVNQFVMRIAPQHQHTPPASPHARSDPPAAAAAALAGLNGSSPHQSPQPSEVKTRELATESTDDGSE
ncbi:hypothetical protein B5M09_005506 [Aphanomyces astaci]|uniref:Uncharacterized protein n=1 Tax=Aphanomyces astaci TaxID=112090 RepID=A0A425D939_APHAT|nr:hypothetical protein B5M09_005506 [Aphanomyces astaci]